MFKKEAAFLEDRLFSPIRELFKELSECFKNFHPQVLIGWKKQALQKRYLSLDIYSLLLFTWSKQKWLF